VELVIITLDQFILVLKEQFGMDKLVFILVLILMLVLMDIIGMVLHVFIMDHHGIIILQFVNMDNFGMDIHVLLQTIIYTLQVKIIMFVHQDTTQMDTSVYHHLLKVVQDQMFGMVTVVILALVMMLHLVKVIVKVELFGEDLDVLVINHNVHQDIFGMELLV
jgi:hypothetical protein